MTATLTARESASASAPASAPPADDAPAPASPEGRAAADLRLRLVGLRRALTERAAPPGLVEALRLVGGLRRLWTGAARPLARRAAAAWPDLAADLAARAAAIERGWRALALALFRGLLRGDRLAAAPALLALLDALDGLVSGRLALAWRPAVACAPHGLDPTAPYPSFRCDAHNRGFVATRPSEAPGRSTALAEVALGGLIWPTFLVDAEGALYGGHARGEMLALEPSGERRWTIADPRLLYIDSTGALGRDGFLYLASTDTDARGHQNQGRIWKVEPRSGRVVWTFWGRHWDDPETNPEAQLASLFEGHVALGWEGGRVVVYAGSDDGHLYKLDDHGAPLWEHRVGDGRAHALIWTKPCLSPRGDAVYVGTVGGEVSAIASATGERLWTRRLPGGVVSSIALGRGGELVFGCFDGAVYALHPEDGALAWRFPTLGLIYASPAIDPESGDIVIGSGDGAVYRLDRFGRRRWSYRTSAPIKSSPLLDGEGACTIGNEQGTLYRIDRAGRRLWSWDSGAGRRNDLNASASLCPDGTVVIGATDGRLFSVGAGYAEAHAGQDPRLSLDPGPDGLAPPIAPGGAALVPLDARGQPELAALAARPTRPAPRLPGEALVLDLLAVDAAGEPVAARLDPAALRVTVDPPRAFAASAPSTGRTVHIVFDDLLPAGRYRVSLEGAYEAAGERRALAQEVLLEVAAPGEGGPPAASADRVPAVLIDGWSLIRPREVDALSQAALDAMTYEVAILHVDRARRTFVAVGSCVALERGRPVWKPRAPNRFVGMGRFDGPAFRIEGPARTIAQGNRCRFERVAMSGRFTAAGSIERGTGVTFLPAEDAQGFTEVVRAMGLADRADRIVSSGRFTARPLAGPEAARPRDLAVEAIARAGRTVEVRFVPASASGADADAGTGAPPDRWLHAVLVCPESGAVTDPDAVPQEVVADADGRPRALRATLPEALAGRAVEVLVLADLFPLLTARLDPEG